VAQIFALIDDLFFQAKLMETAKRTGVELNAFHSGDALLAAMNPRGPQLVIVDLNARQAPVEAISALRSRDSQIPVVAFFSHVQTELAERARQAGCSEVMPRSKFTRELPAIFARAK